MTAKRPSLSAQLKAIRHKQKQTEDDADRYRESEGKCRRCELFKPPSIKILFEREFTGQCRRYPKPIEVSSLHWCGEFRDSHTLRKYEDL